MVLRFRAWDTKNKVWIYTEGYTIEKIASNGYELDEISKNLIWVQSIGLTDKNKQEIWKGDTVSNNEYFHDRGVVEYYKGEWIIRFPDNGFIKLVDSVNSGTIVNHGYQNPELMKGEER